ncbi:MAG: PAS domain-containing protein, partial [Gammaproteobacteria bacterium]|nr:PAS domain-containing protein [Gammaproteobacteria bacterium]
MNINPQNSELQQAFNEFNCISDSSVEYLTNSENLLNETVSSLDRQTPDKKSVPEKGVMSRHLRELLDAIPGAVIVINSKGLVVDVNASAREILPEPLKNELWRDVVNRVFLSELDQGELRTADGRQFSISTRPLGYQPGQILLLSDVTQTRQLQRAAQQNLHLMTMGKMMASLAHQIRTPLSSSMLYLSQIVEGNMAPDKNKKFTAKALARIKHIESMINDMLTFAHGGQFHMIDFSISDLLNE